MPEYERSPWDDFPGSEPERAAEPSEDLSVEAEIGELVRAGRFRDAARLYGQWAGADPIDSKIAIDRLAHKHGLAPRSGCLSYLMLLLLGVGYAFYEGLRFSGQWLG